MEARVENGGEGWRVVVRVQVKGEGEGWKVEVEGDIYIPMSSIASM